MKRKVATGDRKLEIRKKLLLEHTISFPHKQSRTCHTLSCASWARASEERAGGSKITLFTGALSRVRTRQRLCLALVSHNSWRNRYRTKVKICALRQSLSPNRYLEMQLNSVVSCVEYETMAMTDNKPSPALSMLSHDQLRSTTHASCITEKSKSKPVDINLCVML